jgi:hypothetical protein
VCSADLVSTALGQVVFHDLFSLRILTLKYLRAINDIRNIFAMFSLLN